MVGARAVQKWAKTSKCEAREARDARDERGGLELKKLVRTTPYRAQK